MIVGILALQGSFREHEATLQRMGTRTMQVRVPEQLEHIDRLIIPGGESTTIGKLLVAYHLIEPIRARVQRGMPLWGTCAGAILMAKHIAEGRPEGQPALELMNITVRRNAFGRQLDSFETDLTLSQLGDTPFHAVFIRAPILERLGGHVQTLATLEDGRVVAAQEHQMLATCFHPELTNDDRFHRYFLEM